MTEDLGSNMKTAVLREIGWPNLRCATTPTTGTSPDQQRKPCIPLLIFYIAFKRKCTP